jgi:hypothetical protein
MIASHSDTGPSTTAQRRWPLSVLVLLFAVVATVYSVNTPLLEGSDEPAHFEYALAIAQGDGLPLLNLDQYKDMAYEAGQPPFYYALTALEPLPICTALVPRMPAAILVRKLRRPCSFDRGTVMETPSLAHTSPADSKGRRAPEQPQICFKLSQLARACHWDNLRQLSCCRPHIHALACRGASFGLPHGLGVSLMSRSQRATRAQRSRRGTVARIHS